jgi:hypothetical protein
MSHRNQELLIIPVKLEHEGTYRCVAENGLTEAYMEGKVAVNGECIILYCCMAKKEEWRSLYNLS